MTLLVNLGLLLVAFLAFFLAVLGYFLVSQTFQARRRRGVLSKDGVMFLVAGGLFVAFTAGYIEIFEFAFRLPYSVPVDLGIGLLAVTIAAASAYLLANRFEQNRMRLKARQ
ncbi:hypothetical protein [uncultured Roseibium sp.]|uniref:hypothetical protein n=1 Tax=uncultured Roseibium sp. TaxID=1936171 RepID=UPI00263072FD|nr:hypothetical protein [uncultured Roseibium sp.]